MSISSDFWEDLVEKKEAEIKRLKHEINVLRIALIYAKNFAEGAKLVLFESVGCGLCGRMWDRPAGSPFPSHICAGLARTSEWKRYCEASNDEERIEPSRELDKLSKANQFRSGPRV